MTGKKILFPEVGEVAYNIGRIAEVIRITIRFDRIVLRIYFGYFPDTALVREGHRPGSGTAREIYEMLNPTPPKWILRKCA